MFVPRNGLFVPPGPTGSDTMWCDGSEGSDAGNDECFDGGFWLQDGDGSYDASTVSSVAFDSAAEMVWVGYSDGRLTSFLREDTDEEDEEEDEEEDDALPPCNFARYSAVNARTNCVLAIDTDDVCCFLFHLSRHVHTSKRIKSTSTVRRVLALCQSLYLCLARRHPARLLAVLSLFPTPQNTLFL